MDEPRPTLTRALVDEPAVIRMAADGSDGPGTLTGHFAVFNQLTEIDSWEGHFREQIAPGAFTKTFQERRDHIRCIYEHGYDPMFGRKPLGPPEILREDSVGAYYEVPLFDHELNREYVVPAAKARQLGASFRMKIMKHQLDGDPSDGGLPIVTITEVALVEFGPCPFGAYDGATADVRSLIDPDLWRSLDEAARTELAGLLGRHRPRTALDAAAGDPTATEAAAPSTSTTEPADGHSEDPTTPRARRLRALALRGAHQP